MLLPEPNVGRRALAVVGAMACAVWLAGCASPAGLSPQAGLIEPTSLGLGQGQPVVSERWWLAAGDAQLDRLMQQAQAGSPSLKVAQARLARAKAAADVADSQRYPQLNASAQVTRERYTATGPYPPPLAGSTEDLGFVGLSASWELDFFGRNRAALQAALGASRAAQADAEAARLLLTTQVARAYVGWLHTLALQEVAQRTLVQRTDTVRLVQRRVASGLDSTLEMAQGESLLPDARQQLEALREQEQLARHALAVLVGVSPATATFVPATLAALREAPMPAVLPANLLGQRADIVAARWRVEAALKDTDVARAQFYPDINLVASVGLSSIGLDRLFKADSQQWSVGPAVRLPLFDAGRLRANLSGKNADLDAAVESYNGAVLDAVREAVDRIASTQSLQRQRAEQRLAQDSAEKAYRIALLRYQGGLSNYLQVLSAETAVLNQRRLAVDLQARALDAQVGLVRALGGGYRAPVEEAPAPLATTTNTTTNTIAR